MAGANVKKTAEKAAVEKLLPTEKKVHKYICFCRCYIGGRFYRENDEIETTEEMPADMFQEIK